MRWGKVYYGGNLAGIITETDDGEYTFRYDNNYIEKHPADFISFSMPVADKTYRDKRMFPFFDGLIPEGWLLDIAMHSWKLNQNDRMGLLLACCRNCIGTVSVIPVNEPENEK